MKKILLIISFLFLSLNMFAQTDSISLPKYYIVNNDTIGIILSIEQCQKLDHNTELLDLYKKMSIDCDNVEKNYIIIVNKLGDKIALLEVDIKNLKSQNDLQHDMIKNLQKQVSDYESKEKLNQQELINKDEIIKGLKKDLRKQKTKTALGFGGTTIATIGLIVLIIVGGSH